MLSKQSSKKLKKENWWDESWLRQLDQQIKLDKERLKRLKDIRRDIFIYKDMEVGNKFSIKKLLKELLKSK